jgi:hypothetical protein
MPTGPTGPTARPGGGPTGVDEHLAPSGRLDPHRAAAQVARTGRSSHNIRRLVPAPSADRKPTERVRIERVRIEEAPGATWS